MIEETKEGPIVEPIKVEPPEECPAINSTCENQQDEKPVTNHLIKEENLTNQNTDPYAYLEKTGFTSEKFKIEIRNLPKYYGLSVSIPSYFFKCCEGLI